MPEASVAHLQALLEGNARFAQGTAAIERAELALRQAPFAVILGCSDSRVPVETVFDRGPGEIFVVRVAGNVVHDASLASVEYAVAILGASLVLVLGHTGCGAVAAAIERISHGATFPGHIDLLVEAIVPAAEACREGDGEWSERAVVENVRRNVEALVARSQILADAARDGRIAIYGAVYDLHAGKVTLIP